jgi:hypothetical protein
MYPEGTMLEKLLRTTPSILCRIITHWNRMGKPFAVGCVSVFWMGAGRGCFTPWPTRLTSEPIGNAPQRLGTALGFVLEPEG